MRLLLLIFCLSLASCRTKKEATVTSFEGIAMTIPYHILVGTALSPEEVAKVEAAITYVFTQVDTIYNNWNPNSEISRFNRLPAYERVCFSPQLAQFMEKVNEVVQLTDHLFDPTVAPIQMLWRSYLSRGEEAPAKELEMVGLAVGWNTIHSEGGYFWKTHDATALDFGGIAKGYCVDLLAQCLSELGYPHLFISWGGEVRACGHHPSGRFWKVAIKHPLPNQPMKTLDLYQRAIATSGDYEQGGGR